MHRTCGKAYGKALLRGLNMNRVKNSGQKTNSNYVLVLIFVVNIKFPRETYHMIVPSTEELYCLNGELQGRKGSHVPTPISN